MAHRPLSRSAEGGRLPPELEASGPGRRDLRPCGGAWRAPTLTVVGNKADELSAGECLGLIAGCRIGRVAATVGALPVVVPVRFVQLERDLLFFAPGHGAADSAFSGTIVAFEADGVDGDEVWTVQLVGRAELVDDPAILDAAVAAGLVPWRRPGADTLVRLRAAIVSGNRLHSGRPADDALGVRPG